MDYNSKYEGANIEDKLDKVAMLNVVAIDLGVEVEDVVFDYATQKYVDDAIIGAINKEY